MPHLSDAPVQPERPLRPRQPLLELHDFSLSLTAGRTRRPLLDHLDLAIGSGEAVGLVGESGSGKSLTARSLLRMFPRRSVTGGDITFQGRSLLAMSAKDLEQYRRSKIAMIFQDPRAAINPLRSVGDFLTEGLRLSRGFDRRAAEAEAIRLLDTVGIGHAAQRMRQYPHEFSGGMRQRVMIAGALGSGAEVILADEATTALDVSIQAEVVLLLDELRRQNDLALLFITHDLDLATAICDRIVVMYAGSIVEDQAAGNLYRQPRHPYTSALIACRPLVEERQERLASIPGAPVSAATAPPGCAFSTRCAHAEQTCRTEPPALVAAGRGRVRCHRSADLAPLLVPAHGRVS